MTHQPLPINAEIHYPLRQETTIKERDNIIQRYTQILIQKPRQVNFSLNNFLLFWLKHQSVFGKHHTDVLHFFPKLSSRFHQRHDQPWDRPSSETRFLTWWFFASSIWCRLWGTLIIQVIFPKWQKRTPYHEMDAEQAAQQIQALTASLEKVTCKNEELRRAAESQNEERQRTMENQNEEDHWRTEGNHNEEGSNS